MPGATTEIAFNPGDKVRVFQPNWPGRQLQILPGDLSKSVPYGNGVYGYQGSNESNCFTSAPSHEPCGGVIYFGNDICQSDFEALMRIMGVQPSSVVNPSKHFAVFTAESEQPSEDGYLVQMRIVSKFGLRFVFKALTTAEYEKFPQQNLTMMKALWLFIEQERMRWGTSFTHDKGLAGKFGGDGNYEREELAFEIILRQSRIENKKVVDT